MNAAHFEEGDDWRAQLGDREKSGRALELASPRLAYNSRGCTGMNEFQENLAGTALAERHMEAVRQQGGMFVEALKGRLLSKATLGWP